MKLKHLLFASALLWALAELSFAGMPTNEVPYDTCVSTSIAPTINVVSTVPVSVQFSTSATGSPVRTVNQYKRLEITNIGQSDVFVGFNVGVTATTGRVVTSSGTLSTWVLPVMENVRTWLIPNTTNGRVIVTYCK